VAQFSVLRQKDVSRLLREKKKLEKGRIKRGKKKQ